MKIEIYPARKNLGCLAIRIGGFYGDVFFMLNGEPRLFISYPRFKIKGYLSLIKGWIPFP